MREGVIIFFWVMAGIAGMAGEVCIGEFILPYLFCKPAATTVVEPPVAVQPLAADAAAAQQADEEAGGAGLAVLIKGFGGAAAGVAGAIAFAMGVVFVGAILTR